MIEVIKLAGDINLHLANYKWDSSKNVIKKRADQLSAERIQSLLRVRMPHCEIVSLTTVPKVHHVQSRLQESGNECGVFYHIFLGPTLFRFQYYCMPRKVKLLI